MPFITITLINILYAYFYFQIVVIMITYGTESLASLSLQMRVKQRLTCWYLGFAREMIPRLGLHTFGKNSLCINLSKLQSIQKTNSDYQLAHGESNYRRRTPGCSFMWFHEACHAFLKTNTLYSIESEY